VAINGTTTYSGGQIQVSSNSNNPNRVVAAGPNDDINSNQQNVNAAGQRQDGSGTEGATGNNQSVGVIRTPNLYSTTHTLLQSESIVYEDTTSAGYTVTLPAAAGACGQEYIIWNIGSNTLTIQGAGSDDIQLAGGSNANTQTVATLQSATLRCAKNHGGTLQWFMK
jgi:hypothetical protein